MSKSEQQLVKKFKAVLLHGNDMNPLMVLEFCEEVERALARVTEDAIVRIVKENEHDASN